ncbi:hypothetical protein [Streptomyces sp. NPDC001759]
MPFLDNLPDQPAPLRVGDRTVVPLVGAVGPALPSRATFLQLDQDELLHLLQADGDTYGDYSLIRLRTFGQGFAAASAASGPGSRGRGCP